MKKINLISAILMCVSTLSLAQPIYACLKGEVSINSKALIEDIDAQSKQLSAFINTSTNDIAFAVPITSFHFKKALMEEHFNEKYMESDKFPMGTYKGKINEKIDYKKDGTYTITSTGKFTIHGIEKTRTDTATLVIKANQLLLSGTFLVALKDHKIEIPQLMFQKIAEIIKVSFNGAFNPYQKDEKK